ncbi:uncharacterized protein LOC119766869 isoform X2 [Culex quinquefasciatus]|uniref:uncharacterized protein LOC119766869 isoform X2 n=1 Tax=Culex quinquefasciatus TaxID=7176 RepID=UPI0018E30057|nr:uncharacterized protein LOC119766869 isoform X2 [Culex quinquefasciatus]
MDDKKIFWQKMASVLKCMIPEHIKNVVERTGFVNPALEDLNSDGLNLIEINIRTLPEATRFPTDPQLHKYLDCYTQDIRDFRLMAGERALLLKMAQAVKRKGWSYFTQRPSEKRVACSDQLSRTKDEESLRLRILDYYMQRIKSFCTSLYKEERNI